MEHKILTFDKIGKKYGSFWAVKDVDLTVEPGQVHGLVGENGAGKSTLCKIISGAIEPDSGTMNFRGKTVENFSPEHAINRGIFMVYQEGSLAPHLSVAQNVVLGREPLLVHKRSIIKAAQTALDKLGLPIAADLKTFYLPPAGKQLVEIARACYLDAKLIIFDEPTTKLSEFETQRLFDIIEDLTDAGTSVIYISHNLDDVLKISDRVSILRDGQLVSSGQAKEMTKAQIVKQMVGREYQLTKSTTFEDSTSRKKILSVQGIRSRPQVNGMSFSLYAGEIVGMAGLIGSGRTEIAKIIAGHTKRDLIRGGRIWYQGNFVSFRTPRQAVKQGVVYIPEDRKLEGFAPNYSPAQNIYQAKILSSLNSHVRFSAQEEQKDWSHWRDRLKINAPTAATHCEHLSGGNQQKTVVARALSQNPALVIFDEPSVGVDVQAIRDIHKLIVELAESGEVVGVFDEHSVTDKKLV